MLKRGKILGSATALAIGLAACSTPQGPQPDAVTLPSLYPLPTTNAAPALTIVPTKAPVATLPEPTNAPAVAPNLPAPEPVSPPTNRFSPRTWVPLAEWSQSSGWGNPERLRNVPTWSFALRGSRGILEITAGRRTALWNGINLELGFAPRLTNGQVALHTLDLAKTLDPLSRPPTLLQRTNPIVVIDAGHGGFNYGAKSALGDRYEKDFALDWAFRLERLMKARGWKVYLTRTNDVDIPLPERTAFADRVQADLFLSLHFNSMDQPQGRSEQGGIETYCLTPKGMPSTLTRRFDDETWQVYPNNKFDSENYFLAARLHRALVEATRRKDRGLRRARFMGVLRGQNRPAVLLEGGYLTQPGEAELISTASFRQKLAEAIAKALSP